MIIKNFTVIASVAVSCLALSSQQILADTTGSFDYAESASSIKITGCHVSGNVVVPALINGKSVTAIGDNAFYLSREITGISLPSSVTSIGSGAFRRCYKLGSLSIPSGVTSIGSYAFNECTNLKSVSIPSGVTIIGEFTFAGCVSLTNIALPSGVTAIGGSAFEDCYQLTGLIIPQGVTEINSHTFGGCIMIKKINIPSGVKILHDSALAGSGIRSITIPPTVTSVGKAMFTGCSDLTKVDLPPTIEEIADGMFAYCKSLKKFTIPSKVARIGSSAFYRSGLKSIDFPASVSLIDKKAFGDCLALESLVIPDNVKDIEQYAFWGCVNLDNALFLGRAPQLGKGAFLEVSSDFTIFVGPEAEGFTTPKWHGYPTSEPKEEITVLAVDGTRLFDGKSSCDFGDQLIGGRGKKRSFTILNAGIRPLTKLSARIRGGDSSDFTVKLVSKGTLQPGKTAIVQISFKPNAANKRSSSLQILSSDKDETPFDITLQGTGLKILN